ncbi:hypothetical protein V3C99_013627, partial [Haemonchus contortus]
EMSCEENIALIHNIGFQLTIVTQVLACFLSAILSIIVARKCGQLYFHINTRILLRAMLYLNLFHSIVLIALQGIHMIQYLTFDPCHIGLSPILCYSLRYPIASCMVSFAVLQVAMVVERGIALWKRQHYESYGPKLGLAAVFISIGISLMAVLAATGGITQTKPTNYCILNGIATPQNVIILKLGICAIDLLMIIGTVGLFLLNKLCLRRKSYDLQSSYQLFENISVIRIILPLVVSHTIFYIIFTISGTAVSMLHQDLEKVTYVTLTSLTYSIPFYTVMSPILIWLTIRWSRQLKETRLKTLTKPTINENEAYFQSYKEMWSRPRPK